MECKRRSDKQIASALRQTENVTLVVEVCRKLGVSETTFYPSRERFAGLGIVEIERLTPPEEENDKKGCRSAPTSTDNALIKTFAASIHIRPNAATQAGSSR